MTKSQYLLITKVACCLHSLQWLLFPVKVRWMSSVAVSIVATTSMFEDHVFGVGVLVNMFDNWHLDDDLMMSEILVLQ